MRLSVRLLLPLHRSVVTLSTSSKPIFFFGKAVDQALFKGSTAMYSTSPSSQTDDSTQIAVFVKRATDADDADWTLVRVDKGAYVGDLKDAIKAKLGLEESVASINLYKAKDKSLLKAKSTITQAQLKKGQEILFEILESKQKESKALELLPADDPMSVWLKGMLGVDISDEDKVISLEGASWPDLNSNKLFVRFFSRSLWRDVLKSGQDDSLRGAVIVGTPGIAKSAFGLFIVYQAVKSNRTVVFVSKGGGQAMFKERKAYRLPDNVYHLHELVDRNTVYVCDSVAPVPYKGAFRLLISSPGNEKTQWNEFRKSQPPVQPCFLPFFTTEEMLHLHTLAFSEQKLDQVKERMRKWGNNPRNVLTFGENKDWQKALSRGLDGLSLKAMRAVLTTSDVLKAIAGREHFHRLLALVPDGALEGSELAVSDPSYYDFHHVELPSVYIEEKYTNNILARTREHLFAFLGVASEDPAAAGFRGILYERAVVIPRLCSSKPGSFTLKALASPAKDKVKRHDLLQGKNQLSLEDGLARIDFRDVEHLKTLWAEGKEDALFVPLSKHFPVVDLVLRLKGKPILLNATVSMSHDVKVGNPSFLALLSALGLDADDTEIPLVWVLPEDVYDNFKEAGALLGSSGTALSSGPAARHPEGSRVAQYKLLLPVPSSSSQPAKHQRVDSEKEEKTEEEEKEEGK